MSVSQADRVRVQIEDEILSSNLKPGERLDECKLADRYGTSRTPVREALRQLSSNGLVEIRAHKGAIVAKLGIQDVIEIFETLSKLEGACGSLAARSGLKSDIEGIRDSLEKCKEPAEDNDVIAYHTANDAFHYAISVASRNSYLLKLTIAARNRVGIFRRLQLAQLHRPQKSYREHLEIFNAIEQGNAEDADRLLQQHTLNRGADYRRFFAVLAPQQDQTASLNSLYEYSAAK